MKKTMMLAAMLVLMGCGEKKAAEAPAADTAAMAPAAADTGMGTMTHDSAMAPAMSDSTMARDTTAK
jgi:predicted small lipoprotein YifL